MLDTHSPRHALMRLMILQLYHIPDGRVWQSLAVRKKGYIENSVSIIIGTFVAHIVIS